MNYFCRNASWLNKLNILGIFDNEICEIIKYFQENLVCSVGNYIIEVNNKNTRTRCEICSKLARKTPERCPLALGIVLVSFLLTLNIFHTLF